MIQFVCFVGASTVEGMGDEEGLGWPGRLRRLMAPTQPDLVVYNLGVRGHSSKMIAERWQRECAARLPDNAPESGLVVISFGNNDAAELKDGSTRLPLADTIQTAGEIVARCAAWRRTLWIGPTAVDEAKMPFHSRLLGTDLYYRNERLAAISMEFEAIAGRLGVPYLDLLGWLITDETWMRAVGRRDGLHPNGAGYEAAAGHIARWPAWQERIGRDLSLHKS